VSDDSSTSYDSDRPDVLLERDQFNPEHYPVLINGDDILFQADLRFYGIWKEVIKELGFILSVGKNYLHSSVLTVNSAVFRYHYDQPDHLAFEEVPYQNNGLLVGVSKLGVQEGDLPLWALYDKVVHTSPDPVQSHKWFLKYHREEIAKFTCGGKVNLFSPRCLGGLGFTPPSGIPVYYTKYQRSLAGFLFERLQGVSKCMPIIKLKTTRSSPDGLEESGYCPPPEINKGLQVLLPLYGPYRSWCYSGQDLPAPLTPLTEVLESYPKGVSFSSKYVNVADEDKPPKWKWLSHSLPLLSHPPLRPNRFDRSPLSFHSRELSPVIDPQNPLGREFAGEIGDGDQGFQDSSVLAYQYLCPRLLRAFEKAESNRVVSAHFIDSFRRERRVLSLEGWFPRGTGKCFRILPYMIKSDLGLSQVSADPSSQREGDQHHA
jgi:hypothetical protein